MHGLLSLYPRFSIYIIATVQMGNLMGSMKRPSIFLYVTIRKIVFQSSLVSSLSILHPSAIYNRFDIKNRKCSKKRNKIK